MPTDRKVLVLMTLPMIALLTGVVAPGTAVATAAADGARLLQGVASVAAITVWFWLDADSRNYPTSWALRILMPVLTVAALPYYLFRSRGFKGGLRAWALAVLLLCVTMLAYRIGALLAHAGTPT